MSLGVHRSLQSAQLCTHRRGQDWKLLGPIKEPDACSSIWYVNPLPVTIEISALAVPKRQMVATKTRRNCSRLTTFPFLHRSPVLSVCRSARFRQRELSDSDLDGRRTKLASKMVDSRLVYDRVWPSTCPRVSALSTVGLFSSSPTQRFSLKKTFFSYHAQTQLN